MHNHVLPYLVLHPLIPTKNYSLRRCASEYQAYMEMARQNPSPISTGYSNICFILRAALFGSGARIYADTTLVPLGRAVRGLFPNDIPCPLRARGSFGVVALPIYSWAHGHPGALWQFKVSIATICK